MNSKHLMQQKADRSRPKPISAVSRSHFPPSWTWLVDELIPNFVKRRYSPRESWKKKPFSNEDLQFFLKSIEDLSELFTEDRPKTMPSYFNHARYRSAYLLYFLPLQAAKFLTLFDLFPEAMKSMSESVSQQSGVLSIADLGAGPGTASLAVLLHLMKRDQSSQTKLPQIQFHWFDTNMASMDDGKALIEQFCDHFPTLRGKVEVHLHVKPWWKAASELLQTQSFILLGHVLNESSISERESLATWKKLTQISEGAGILIVEPAARKTAQNLSQFRDWIFHSQILDKSPSQIWGPCLHSKSCPLAMGRDWCHFSIPIQIPGKWFREFSKGLGSERQWVKFSYLWLTSNHYPSSPAHPELRRVVSDPLLSSGQPLVLLCEPEVPRRWKISKHQRIQRGDLIRIGSPVKR